MNTVLLIQQLTIAIVASAIVIPTIQRVKGWMPNAKSVEFISVALSMLIGFGFALYYVEYSLIDALIVGFFSVIGADNIYKLLEEKLKTFSEVKQEELEYESTPDYNEQELG